MMAMMMVVIIIILRQQFSDCTLRVFTTGSDKLNKNMSMFEMFSKTIEVRMESQKKIMIKIILINIIRHGWSSRRWRSSWPSSGSARATSRSSPMPRGTPRLPW